MNDSTMTKRCLATYQTLPKGATTDYLPAAARKLFGTIELPVIDFDRSQLDELGQAVIHSQTTLTGVQPKLSLSIDKGKENQPTRLTVLGLWGSFILKPQSDHFPHLPELEDATMHLASLAGIEVVPHGLIKMANGELSYITRRIDRSLTGEKFPMEDFCQLSQRLTEHKYQGSHEQIANLIKTYSARPSFDLLTYWEVVIFSWLVGNADMHLKNFSLYRPRKDGGYRLSPAYDLLSTKLVLPEDKEELALTLIGKKRNLHGRHFRAVMNDFGINQKVIDNTFTKFHRISPKWFELIEASFLPEDMQKGLTTIIRERLQKLV